MNLDGASAIVTGGASGIGESSARALAELGARVVIADIQDDLGRALAKELDGVFVHCDVTSESEVANAVTSATQIGPLRALVGSAGRGGPARVVDRDNEPMPQDAFERIIRINLLGTFNVLRQSAAAMARTEPLDPDGARGAIVNIASIAAFDGQIGQTPYAASKGGIVALTLPAARDLSAVGVRVNTVAPGLIDTPIYGEGERAEKMKSHLSESALFPKRLGSAEELAYVVIECLTNPYLNGEVIRVDAGARLAAK
ncbi:MAG: SDR family NAD(P)-dependent oxidoreductase [Acidimicrobiales bacterium]